MKTENPIILRPKKWKIGIYLFGMLLVTGYGYWIATEEVLVNHVGIFAVGIGWLTFGFSGLGSTVFFAMLLPNSTYLRIDSSGFTMCSFFRTQSYQWNDIQQFGIIEMPRGFGPFTPVRMVGVNFSPHVKTHQRMRKCSKKLSGYEGGISDIHGMNHEVLLDMLNQWKDQYTV